MSGGKLRWAAIGVVALVVLLGTATRHGGGDPHDYTFERQVGRKPVAWPCAPIRYTVSTAEAPADFARIVHGAVGLVSAASGYRFVYVGPTADRDFRWYQGGPVLIGFANPGEVDDLTGDVVGIGGGIPTPDGRHYASGMVALDAEFYRHASDPALRRAVVEHELGHVLGLGHSRKSDEVMAARNGATSLRAGELAGLEALYRASCS